MKRKNSLVTPNFLEVWGFSVKICVVFLLLLLPANMLWAQKQSTKVWEARNFSKLVITGDVASTIHLKSTPKEVLQVSVTIAGESYEHIMPAISERDSTLSLTLEYRPFFNPTDDKLAAHKVITGEWYLLVPERYEVYIESDKASLRFKGAFKNLEVLLASGWCMGKRFEGNAFIQTKQGNITIQADPSVAAAARSEHGTVRNELIKKGVYEMKVESKYGNIDLQKTQ